MIEQALYTKMAATSAISSLVSSRIYPIIAPQDASLPYLVYRRIDTDHETAKTANGGLARALVEITAVASTYSGARSLADKVRIALQAFDGTVSVSGVGNYIVQGILPQGESDVPEYPTDATDIPRHKVGLDFAVWFQETAPTG